jgi:D-3-phosphoglycerate dehydrogenase
MRVLVTDPIDQIGLDLILDAGHELEVMTDVDGDTLVDEVADVDALVIRGTEITRELFENAPKLQVVARAGIGVDNIDIDAATDHGVVVANAPWGNVHAAAEHTIALALSVCGAVPQAHHRLRAGDWSPADFSGTLLDGGTVSIIGLGRVGQRVASWYGDFGMELVAYDPYLGQDRAAQLGVELVDDIETAFERADLVSVNAPRTDETIDLVDESELSILDGDYLVHTGRGGVVNEAALADAVEAGHVAGAGVDVFDVEPLPADNPLLRVEDVIVTPHLGGTTYNAQENVARAAAENVLSAFEGDPVQNALNIPRPTTDEKLTVRPYVDIAETASKVATRLFGERIESIEVTFAGEIAEEEDVELATARVFRPFGWQVPVVDAPSKIAERRGLDVAVTRRWAASGFQSLVSVTAASDERELTVSGTLLADGDPHLVSIDGFRVEAAPHGHMLIVRNSDEPGVIGFVGTVLGDHDVNIAGMANSRETIDGEALTVYNLDDPLPDAARDALEADDRIYQVSTIGLGR